MDDDDGGVGVGDSPNGHTGERGVMATKQERLSRDGAWVNVG